MAEPIVQSFIVDTSKSEQNLENLNAKINDINDSLGEIKVDPAALDAANNSLADIGDQAGKTADKLDESAASAKKLGDNAKGAESGFKKVGSGGTSTVTFSSIPATYKHLQLRVLFQLSSANWINVAFNSDTTNTNYYAHDLRGDGSSATSSAPGNQRLLLLQNVATASNTFGSGVVDILDYASTTKNKTVRTLQGYDANGSGNLDFNSLLWMNNTTAINSITFTASTIQQYSQFALYGIKG